VARGVLAGFKALTEPQEPELENITRTFDHTLTQTVALVAQQPWISLRVASGHTAARESRSFVVGQSGCLCRGTLQQFSQIVDINSARVTDHKIAEAAMTPSFHIER
jgi:hypothetical protein